MAVAYLTSSVPEICISPAPVQEAFPEPKSPFNTLNSPVLSSASEDNYRPVLLTPPAVHSPRRLSPLSPLRPEDAPVKGEGLERERFEALLRSSRERNASVGARKAQDLRKELALKQHKSKQMERRALFLSKVAAPPSPSAANVPKTPPESPAILHYSLPSPGLASPIAAFDGQPLSPRKGWVEQVDFRLPEGERTKRASRPSRPSRAPLPSLEQISARLNAQRQAAIDATAPEPAPVAATKRLPAFLQRRSPSPPTAAEPATPRLSRLQIPVRPQTNAESTSVCTVPTVLITPADEEPLVLYQPPKTPSSPKLTVTTTVVPRWSNVSPIELTEANLRVFNSRSHTSQSMLTALRRRGPVPGLTSGAADDADVVPASPTRDEVKFLRRQSAPANLSPRDRAAFASPRLRLPGAF